MAAAATPVQHPDEEEVSWAELPSDFVYLIMDKLSSSPQYFMLDYIRFSSICTSWNFLYYHHNPPPQPPLLMVPPSLKKKKKHKTKVRKFYNVCDKKLDPTLQVSMPRYRHCCGSSHGWLITVDDHGFLLSVNHDYENNHVATEDEIWDIRLAAQDIRFIRLFNPFLQGTASGINEIVLSSLSSIPFRSTVNSYSFLKKAVLSANPISNPTNYIVMAIYDNSKRLAFFKPGNKVWTDVKLPEDLNEDPGKGYFQDVIYWRGEFHAIHPSGRVFVCEEEVGATEAGQGGGGGGMKAKEVGQPLEIEQENTKKYLVVSSDGRKLMQVHRDIEHESCFSSTSQIKPAADAGRTLYSTVGFRVFQLVMEPGGVTEDLYNWVEVKSLCGETMFLGYNASLSISASSNHPGREPNCIYFTDDSEFHWSRNERIDPHDMGVFNFEDGSIDRYFPIDPNNTSTQPVRIWPAPIWIQPTIPKCRSKQVKQQPNINIDLRMKKNNNNSSISSNINHSDARACMH